MELIWKCEKLKGRPEYEDLISLIKQYEGNSSPLRPFVIDKLNLLLHQLSVIEKTDQQGKFLNEVLNWFKRHSGEKKSPLKVLTQTVPGELVTQKIKKKPEKPEREKPRKLDDWRFLLQKQKDMHKWAVRQNRSKEEFMYRLEVKTKSHNSLKRRSSDVVTKMKDVKDKLRYIELVRKDKKSKKRGFEFSPDMKEIEDVKKKLSKRGVSISNKVLEPISFYLSPVGNPGYLKLGFPESGEGLLKK